MINYLYFDTIENLDLPDLTNKIIGKEIDQVFPLTFVTRIKCDKEYYEGQVDNFNSLAD